MKIKKIGLVRLDSDINAGNSTNSTPVGINTVKTTLLENARRTKPRRCGKQPSPSPAHEVATKAQSKADREIKETESPALSGTAMRDPML